MSKNNYILKSDKDKMYKDINQTIKRSSTFKEGVTTFTEEGINNLKLEIEGLINVYASLENGI